jgi:hypothetical protein
MSFDNSIGAIAISRKTALRSSLTPYFPNDLLKSVPCTAHSDVDEFLGAGLSGADLSYGFITSPA